MEVATLDATRVSFSASDGLLNNLIENELEEYETQTQIWFKFKQTINWEILKQNFLYIHVLMLDCNGICTVQ